MKRFPIEPYPAVEATLSQLEIALVHSYVQEQRRVETGGEDFH